MNEPSIELVRYTMKRRKLMQRLAEGKIAQTSPKRQDVRAAKRILAESRAASEREASHVEQAIKHLRQRGYTVFTESTVNPGARGYRVGRRHNVEVADLIAIAERIGFNRKEA